MHIKFLGDLEQYQDRELFVDNLRQLLAGLKHLYGQELADKLTAEQYKYVLMDSNNPEKGLSIHPELATMNFGEYDTLLIVPTVSGEIPVAMVAVALSVAATSATAIIVTAVINIALSIALSMLVNMLSPTPEFSKDPAAAQKLDSALFNGAPNIREQGGSVPLVYGNTHCGGVLISAGLSTEEKTV